MALLNKNIVLIIALVVVAIVGYFTFTRDMKPTELVTTTEGAPALQGGEVGQELVIELNRLKALRNINSEVLASPVFGSLLDFTQPVPVQPLGRLDPFAPVGSGL